MEVDVTTADTLARALQARRSGSTWMAKCPAHEDRNPSLAIREGDGGNVLLHCHAGCRQRDVIDALKARGLWESDFNHDRVIIATYPYTDEAGKLLYEVVRYEPKGFKQRRPDGHGGWIWKKGERQVLYHLSEVLEAPIVFLVEGEKDTEKLRSHGFVATTNAGGANAPWLPEFTAALKGREVILIPDNDQPGWKRAALIARALLHIAARIRVFDLPDGFRDISDWFAAGHSESQLIADLEGVDAV
jgi:putative DNA primase/helicase